MIDLVFDLEGKTLPVDYPFSLWSEIARLAPRLAEEKHVGILPLRTSESNEGLLLPKRAKLVLRLPAGLVRYAEAHLSGQQLDISGHAGHPGDVSLLVGKSRPHRIQPHPTIHAQLVTGASEEEDFTKSINLQLGEMGIKGSLICGKRRTLKGDQYAIHGFSLVIHDLEPEASLQLQYRGLGEEHRYGCGIFLPHKAISGL